LCEHSWRVVIDCYRTTAPLSFPPTVLSLAALYTAAMLQVGSTKPHKVPSSDGKDMSPASVINLIGNSGTWEQRFSASAGQVDDVTHSLLDLYITVLSIPSDLQTFASPSPVSPKETNPASKPASTLTTQASCTAFRLPAFWTPQTLTELKIHLREKRPSAAAPASGWTSVNEDDRREVEEAVEGMGQNDATVRFVWDQNGVALA